MNIFQYIYYNLSLFLTKEIIIGSKAFPTTTLIIIAIWSFVAIYIIYHGIKYGIGYLTGNNYSKSDDRYKYTTDEYKQLKRIKKHNSINSSNVFVDNWVQRVYDDGIIFILHDVYVDNNNKPIPDLHLEPAPQLNN